MKAALYAVALFAVASILAAGCTEKYRIETHEFSAEGSSCSYCHLNSTLLQQVATPLPDGSGGSGEG